MYSAYGTGTMWCKQWQARARLHAGARARKACTTELKLNLGKFRHPVPSDASKTGSSDPTVPHCQVTCRRLGTISTSASQPHTKPQASNARVLATPEQISRSVPRIGPTSFNLGLAAFCMAHSQWSRKRNARSSVCSGPKQFKSDTTPEKKAPARWSCIPTFHLGIARCFGWRTAEGAEKQGHARGSVRSVWVCSL